MTLTKNKKNEIIKEVKEKLNKQKSMIFVDFTGLDAKKNTDLKKMLKNSGCQMKVIKKNLFRVTLQEIKNPLWEKVSDLNGQLAVVFGFEEENDSPKITYKFSKDSEKFEILGGYFNQEYKSAQEVIEIAKLPSRKELLSNLLNVISAPRSNFVYALKGNLQNLICVLDKIKK